MGQENMMNEQPAFYARTGTRTGDFLALLHPPYTAWNMSYAVIGAALAPDISWLRLVLVLAAFFGGTGITSHALDELNGRPLKTGFSRGELKLIATAGAGIAVVAAAVGALVISPWIFLFAGVGFFLVAAYSLEWWGGMIHTDLGFGLAWGGFPVLVGFWAQAKTFSSAALITAGAATLLSLTQRSLSTRARFVRRKTTQGAAVFQTSEGEVHWSREDLLNSWEAPLRLLSWTVVVFACGLIALRI
jgi:hypothetical protein